MLRFIRETMNPAGYHGRGKQAPYFEGWYYKLVDATEQHRYAIIPGVFFGHDEARNHAFVQVSDGSTGAVTYHSYRLSEFSASQEGFDIRVGPNRFTAHNLALDIHTADRTVRGEVRFPEIAPWPVRVCSPGIMGWYAWAPFMQTYHGVVSLDHTLVGQLEIDGSALDFGGEREHLGRTRP
jgi:tocopherol cyclase